MAADAHATARSVAIVWCASRGARVVEGVVGEVAVGVEGVGVFEMGVVVVGGEGVHVEIGSCGDSGVVPCDGFDRAPGQTNGDDGPEAERFFDESSDVGAFFFVEAAFPGVVVGVLRDDFLVGAFLDVLAVRGGEVRDALFLRDGVSWGSSYFRFD